MRPLAVLGNINIDLIAGPLPPWPRVGTETIVDGSELRIGGAAGNCALTWRSLGVPYQVAGGVGDDHFGRWLAEAFGADAERWAVAAGVPTSLSIGLTHPNGERTFVSTPGHLSRLTWTEARAMIDWETLAGGYLLLCGCFFTETLAADYHALFDWAAEQDIAIVLDTGWPPRGWSEEVHARERHWLSHSSAVLLNEIEAITLSGVDDPEAAAHRVRAMMPADALVVVKLGPLGALALDAEGLCHRVAAPAVTVVDTIGAGDVFNAAFLAALARGMPLPHCLDLGVRVASKAVSTHPRRYDGDDYFSAKGGDR